MTKITPPPELIEKWITEAERLRRVESFEVIAAKIVLLAYKAGADQELEACCEWLRSQYHSEAWVDQLLAIRRPKPSSLKEQALRRLDYVTAFGDDKDIIRRALEQLDD